METYEYPLLCWQVRPDLLYGQLVDEDYQMAASDLRSLKAAFTEMIEKKLRESDFSVPRLAQAKIKTFVIPLRPHYRKEERIFPVIETIEVSVTAVYGPTDQGYFLCYLPSLNRNFYYYEPKDLPKLAEHFAREVLFGMTPEALYKLMLPGTPWLETVSARLNKPKQIQKEQFNLKNTVPNLFTLAENLPYAHKGNRAANPDQTWERGDKVNQIINLLVEERSNVLVVGKSGVGKSAVLREVIRRVHNREKSYDAIERHTFWRSSPARITAKARYLGEWQMICEELIYDLSSVRGLLWVENFVSLATTGGEGAEDSMAAFMMPFVRQGKLRLLAELTPEQLEAMRRLMPGFVDYFRVVWIEEMDMETSLRIFRYFAEYVQKNLKMEFSPSALETAYALLDRFARYESFPGKAVKFMQTCVNQALQENHKKLENLDIIRIFSHETGIPDTLLRDDKPLYDQELRQFFLSRIKGQDQVIDKICAIIKVFKTGLNDPNKPIATMIFAGPTGVGKTATAKAISEFFFGMGQGYRPLIRLDMSEFQHPGQIYRLIGPEGKLVQHVRERPFSVVLFDEIEKANPLIFDALLTVMDEGLLLDAAGRITDFRNTLIIMTSNLGTTQRSSLGFRQYQGHDYEADIKAFFRPEFYNRIDYCLIFSPLDEKTIHDISRYELAQIDKREGFQQRGLSLRFTEALIAYLGQVGFDKKYGARPLQREIERLVVAPLARTLMDLPQLKNQVIEVDAKDNQVQFNF
ncbi:MAG: ATP-dependent Clp protease ATP-binding subunit [Microscillaceae bacterium]|nr:ATP-dependent Clp protease ATP-binding subunit [Microscillaceae bacterium]